MCTGNSCPTPNVAMLIQIVDEFQSLIGDGKANIARAPRAPGRLPQPDPRLEKLIQEKVDMKVQFDLLYNAILASIGSGASGSPANASGLQPDVVAKRYNSARCAE